MKIVITGSSGMLGRALCRELKNKYEIWGLDLVTVHRSPFTVDRFVERDITDKEKLFATVGEIKPDLIIHTAGYTDVDGCELEPDKAYSVNGKGTENVALACKEHNAVLVYISTDFVFDGTKDGEYNEEDAPNPINVYGKSKLMGEEAVKKLLKKFYIIRTSWLFGEGGRNFVDAIIEKAKRQKRIEVVSDQFGRPSYTVDLAQAIERLIIDMERIPFGIYHIASGSICSWYDLAREALSLAKLNGVSPGQVSSDEYKTPASRPRNCVLDITKFESAADIKMRGHKYALGEYLEKVKAGLCHR